MKYSQNTDTLRLSTEWKNYDFLEPADRSFSINFLNDGGVHSDVEFKDANHFDIWYPSFNTWKCGSNKEDIRCKTVKEGHLGWQGEYTFVIRPKGTLHEKQTFFEIFIFSTLCALNK